MEVATLFQSEKFETLPKYQEIYPIVITEINQICKDLGIDSVDKKITFNTTKILFYLNHSSQAGRYFLCFLPENVWPKNTKKSNLVTAFNDTIDFFNLLPEKIFCDDIEFNKSKIDREINTSKWKFTTDPDIGLHNLEDINYLPNIIKIGKFITENYKNSIDKKLLFIDGVNAVDQSKSKTLLAKISVLFKEKPQIIKLDETILESIDNRTDKDKLFLVFFGSEELFENYYVKCKQYLLSKNIPSQFITLNRYDNIMSFGSENLFFEIIKKALKKDAIRLETTPQINIDGFLCLSDIFSINKKLFGVSISLSGRGTANEQVEIYNDIDYKAEFEKIDFTEENLRLLGKKIEKISGLANKMIDIYVTKRWRISSAGKLIKILDDYEISVRRFIYISNYTNKFLISPLVNEENINRNMYVIWDDVTASIQTNTKIQLYGTMFPIYIELLNPRTSGKLTENDMVILLWLVKKRIYRLRNFYNLKLPEFMGIFDDPKTMTIVSNCGKFKLDLNDLI
jgi:hypothetical protein